MKKRLLASLLSLAMVATMMPAALADDVTDGSTDGSSAADSMKYVAKVGEQEYQSVNAAIKVAGEGQTVSLLYDINEDVAIAKGQNVTLDLNGKTLTNKSGNTITVDLGASLTIEGEGTVDNVTHAKAAVWNNGTCYLNGGTYDRSKENGKTKDDSGNNSFYAVLNHGTMEINEGATIYQNGHYSSLLENGYQDAGSGNQSTGYVAGINAKNPMLTINGGLFTGGLNTVKNDDNGIITINNGTFTNVTQAAFQNHNVATINGGMFDAPGYDAVLNCGVCGKTYTGGEHKLDITNGKFKGAVAKTLGSVTITGGEFSVDPTAYLADNKVVVSNDDKDCPYTVADVVDNVEVATISTSAKADTSNYQEGSDEAEAMNKAAAAISGTGNKTKIRGLDTIGNEAAAKITNDVVNEATKKLAEEKITPPASGAVTVYVEPYMDITVKDIDLNADNLNVPVGITLDITPRIKKVASIAASVDDVKLTGEARNAIQLSDDEVTVNTPVTLTIPMPEKFEAADKIVVKHEKDGKFICYHAATYNEGNNTVKFTNNKGFSTFTVQNDTRSAKIQFTDKDGNKTGNVVDYDALKVGENLPTAEVPSGYKFAGWSFKSEDEVISGTYTTMTEELLSKLDNQYRVYTATPVFASTSSSSGSSGGGSSSSSTYKVTVATVSNGSAKASASTAAKDATVTVTLSPDKGYKLDKITVTDASGKEIATTKKSDTSYTFTMPASAVTVKVAYVKDDAAVVEPTTGFNDVADKDWFADAVKYVTDKGMMNGTSKTTFGPNDSTTRGMIVTVLYRLENEPSAAAASFTDVVSGQYYTDAVAWANANGIVTGYGNGKFGPNDVVTREQLAAILYRYAQYKKYDVSVGEDTNILSYADAQSVSAYAIPAMQWAGGAGIVNGSNGKLNPQNNATRAEVATMLMRYCEKVAK